MKRILLTKEKLIEYGITEVTRDGRVFKGDKECSYYKIPYKQKAKGTVRHYLAIQVYDKDLYQKQKETKAKFCIGVKNILLHRVVYAWFYGICPRELDIDHIDNNSFNNAVSNLQALTRLENNRRKSSQRNQHNYKWTEEEMKQYQELKRQLDSEVTEAKWQYTAWKGEYDKARYLKTQALSNENMTDYTKYKDREKHLREHVKTTKAKLTAERKRRNYLLDTLKKEFNKGE